MSSPTENESQEDFSEVIAYMEKKQEEVDNEIEEWLKSQDLLDIYDAIDAYIVEKEEAANEKVAAWVEQQGLTGAFNKIDACLQMRSLTRRTLKPG
jgi:hypothetical protein